MIDLALAELKSAHTALSKTRDEFRLQLKDADKDLSHHYHVLEMVTMDASQLAKVTKSLRAVLNKRRELKEAMSLFDSALAGELFGATDVLRRRNKVVIGYRAEAEQNFARILGQWNKS